MAGTVSKSTGLSARAAIPSVINGAGIRSIEQTEKSIEDDGVNVVTITTTDGKEVKFEVKNGSKGSQGLRGEKGDPGIDGKDGASSWGDIKDKPFYYNVIRSVSWDGNTDGLEATTINGKTFYKISDVIIGWDDVIHSDHIFTATLSTGESFVVSRDRVAMDPQYIQIDIVAKGAASTFIKSFSVTSVNFSDGSILEVPSTGTYCHCELENGLAFVKKFDVALSKTIDKECIPDDIRNSPYEISRLESTINKALGNYINDIDALIGNVIIDEGV